MIYTSLYPWQKTIVDQIMDKQAYGLFLDMGLGKTPLSLSLCERHKCDRVIIVTLKGKAVERDSTPGSWKNWFTKYAIGDVTPSSLVINYEAIYDRKALKLSKIEFSQTLKQFLSTCPNHRIALVLDESHRIKDSSSAQSRAIRKLRNYLQAIGSGFYLYLLTGTPFSTGFIDLYNQLSFLGCPMTKAAFKEQFCVLGRIPGLLEWQQPIVRYKNIDKLYSLVHQYALTIKSEEVIDLPDQIFVEHLCPENEWFTLFTKRSISRTKFDQICSKRDAIGVPSPPYEYRLSPPSLTPRAKTVINPWYRNINFPDLTCVADTPALLWLRARQLSVGFQSDDTKTTWYSLDRINRISQFLVDHEDNYVIFYNYYAEFYALYDMLESIGYNVDVYNGAIKSLYFYEKYAAQDEVQRISNKRNVILANFA